MPSNEEDIDHNVLIDDEDLEEEDDDDEEEEEDLESDDEDDEDDDNPQHPLKEEEGDHFPFAPLPTTTTTIPTTTPTLLPHSSPDRKRLRPTTTTTTAATPITTLTVHPSASSSSSLLALPTPLPIHEEEKKPSAFDDSRRLFQRLWTDEDEIGLLQGFLEYTSQRGGFKNSAYHHDTAPFYDQIKSRLQLDFNKNQLVEKLRRLKKKYRNVMTRINSGKDYSFKTPHDEATFEISKKIWSGIGGVGETALMDDDEQGNPNPSPNPNPNPLRFHSNADNNGIRSEKKPSGSSSRSRKRSRSSAGGPVAGGEENVLEAHPSLLNCPVNSSIPNVIEDTVRSCLSPLFKELMSSAVNGPGNLRGLGVMALNPLQLNFGGNSAMNFLGGSGEKEREVMDEKWRKQQILELEVYSKRVELVQDQIKLSLQELRSSGSQ